MICFLLFCKDRNPANPFDPTVKLHSPIPIEPIANTYISTNIPTFIWTPVKGAESYELVAANNADFQNIRIQEEVLSDTIFKITDRLDDAQYYWKVRVINRSNWSKIESFVVDTRPPSPPIISAPSDSTATNTEVLVFDWIDNAEIEYYQIQIDNESDFATPAINDSMLNDSEYSLITSISDGAYFWRVRAFDMAHNISQWSNKSVFIIDKTIPNLIKPGDGTITNNNKPAFSWNTYRNVLEYQFQLDKSIDFSSLQLNQSSIPSNEYTIDQSREDGCYYWRVRSKNIEGSWMNWSNAWTLTIDTKGPEAPTLLNPSDKSVIKDDRPTFEWQIGQDIEEYHIQIGEDSAFSINIFDQQGIKSALFTSSIPFEIGSYYWHLRAKDQAGNWGDWSSPYRFTVDRLKWKIQTASSISSSPALGVDGKIYIKSDDGYLYAINPDGSYNWKRSPSSYGIVSSPLVSPDGSIYISCDNSVFGYNADGSIKWTFRAMGQRTMENNTLAVDDQGVLYACLYDYSPHYSTLLYAFYPDGSIKWRYNISDTYMIDFLYPKVNIDGTILIGDAGIGQLLVINSNGTLNKEINIGIDMDQDVAISAEGYIVFGSTDNYIYSYKLDGTQRWKYLTGDDIYSTAAIGADGTIYIGSDDTYLYALDMDGNLKWKYKTGGRIVTSPVIGSDGIVYIRAVDGFIYALNYIGVCVWQYDIGTTTPSSPAISDNGTLIFGSGVGGAYPGFLYALRCSSKGIINSAWPKYLHDNQNTSRY